MKQMQIVMIAIMIFGKLNVCSGNSNRLPVPQSGHHMIEVGHDHSIWLLPGFAGDTILKDIHVLTDDGWQKKMSMPFADRTWYSATPMPALNQVMFFGGKTMDRQPFDETWVWDGNVFSQYKGPTPSPRSHHTATYDPIRQVVVVFGGDAHGVLLNDIWEWNGFIWKQREAMGPAPQPRAAHMAAFDPQTKRVIVAGGVHADNKTRFQDAWAWNGMRWESLANLPKPLAAAAMSQTADGVFMAGGWSEGFESINQIYQLVNAEWSLQSKDFGPRSFSTMSYLAHKGKLILSGGMDADFKPLDDIHLVSKDL